MDSADQKVADPDLGPRAIGSLPTAFLVCAGRTGSGFLHSLLDNHPQVLTLPMELKFHQMWERLRCNEISLAEKMVDIWCSQTKLKRLKTGIHYGYENGNSTYTNCDFAKFKKRFYEILSVSDLNRIATFFAIHQAYAESAGQDIDKMKIIVEFSANPMWLDQALGDFPKAKIIQIVRDPRATYASLKQGYLNTVRSLIDFNARALKQKLVPIHVLTVLSASTNKLSESGKSLKKENFFVVRLEDFHPSLEPPIRNTANWLGIDFKPCLLESTLGARPWLGNSAYGNPVKGVPREIIDRWKQKISKAEIALIEYIFRDEMRRFKYELSTGDNKLSRRSVLIASLLPFRDEFLLCISQKRPTRGKWIALWNISPTLIFAMRWLHELIRMPVRLLYYPISRFYLLKFILRVPAPAQTPR